MSLPLPVFRLDTRVELPFEPLCAIVPDDSTAGAATASGFLSRLQDWFAHPRVPVSGGVEGG